MDSIWLWPLAAVALVFALPAARDVAARLASAHLHRQVSGTAPDRISLVRVREPRWRNVRDVAFAERDLAVAGFAEAGAYVVREMPELTLSLHALPGEHAYAVVYDHPRSGSWTELVTRYADGSISCFTTLEALDVEVPEGSQHVAAPALGVGALWRRMLAERPRKPMLACSPAAAAADFERGYAESVARHQRATRMVLDPLVGIEVPVVADIVPDPAEIPARAALTAPEGAEGLPAIVPAAPALTLAPLEPEDEAREAPSLANTPLARVPAAPAAQLSLFQPGSGDPSPEASDEDDEELREAA